MRDHKVFEGEIISFGDYTRKGLSDRSEFDKLPSVWDSLVIEDGIAKYSHFTTKENMEKLTDRIKASYERLHGNYAKMDTVGLNKSAIGRLILMFRKWMKPGFDRRFAGMHFGKKIKINENTGLPVLDKNGNPVLEDYDRFDQRLSENVAGIYAVSLNFMQKYLTDIKSFSVSMMREDYKNLPQWKKALIREAMMEIFFIAGTTLLVTMLSYLDLDDEDELAAWMAGFGEYQANRLNTEMLMWFNPSDGLKIMRSPMAGITVAEDILTFGGRLITPEGWTAYESGPYAGQLKVARSFKKITPGAAQYDRLTLDGLNSALQWIK